MGFLRSIFARLTNPDLDAVRSQYYRGVAHLDGNRIAEAIDELLAALELNPSYGDGIIHLALSKAYVEEGCLDEAIQHCRAVLEINPRSAEAHNMLGLLYGQQGRGDEAISEFQAALSINPSYFDAHCNLATLYADTEQWDEAISGYKAALRINPDCPDVHRSLGMALCEMGRWDEATGALQAAVRLADRQAGGVSAEVLEGSGDDRGGRQDSEIYMPDDIGHRPHLSPDRSPSDTSREEEGVPEAEAQQAQDSDHPAEDTLQPEPVEEAVSAAPGWRWALVGGAAVALVMGAGLWLHGVIAGRSAAPLLTTEIPRRSSALWPTVTPTEAEELPSRATPERVSRTGALVDTIIVIEEPSVEEAITRIEVGDVDLYPARGSAPESGERIGAPETVESHASFASFYELTFNPSGPVFEGTDKLNPFSVSRIREAVNYMIDRDHIARELMGGLGTPRWLPFHTVSDDYALLAAEARALELKYAYNVELAERIITEEMEALGATMEGGLWHYEGESVEILLLIRIEDERLSIGDYVGDQLEALGFNVSRDYVTMEEASPIWYWSDPADGMFHIYTGRWITTLVPHTALINFDYFYTDMGLPSPPWMEYENTAEFYELARRLDCGDSGDINGRYDLTLKAMERGLKDSYHVWLSDQVDIIYKGSEVSVVADSYGGVAASWLWPVTIRREGRSTGSLTVAMPRILAEPWNPLGGTDSVYDMMLIRGTAEMGHIPDPYTGLWHPRRFERAEVVAEQGLPVFSTLDWVDLEFADEISVPDDAWAAWDPVEQRFLTAGEVYTEPETVARKSTVYYPDDLFETVTWHDGSPLSVGDFVMAMIMSFDRAQEESAVYDSSVVSTFESFTADFRGVRIVSEAPLIIEHYTNHHMRDAEQSLNSWYPYFGCGPGSWHMLTLGLMAEANLDAAFTSSKAAAADVEWINYIAGAGVEILETQLDEVLESGEIPYAATLGEYIDEAEIEARFANYAEWFRRTGHFWIGTGPFWLQGAFPAERTVLLQRSLYYPDRGDKWLGFVEAPVTDVELAGPRRVVGGEDTAYHIRVNFAGEPYRRHHVQNVKYLIIDSTDAVAGLDRATPVEDGLWEIVLDGEVSRDLGAGVYRLEVIVLPRLVVPPEFGFLTFLIAP